MQNSEKNIIHNKLLTVRQRIRDAAINNGRNPDEITLLAVSKTRSWQDIQLVCQQGQLQFGESYLQEAVGKIDILRQQPIGKNIEWHFIGPIQSNKTRQIASHFGWVQSIDRLKIAHRLNQARPEEFARLNVLIQVNIDHEASKSGVSAEQITPLAEEIHKLPRLRLRGLMAIPAPQDDPARQQQQFSRIRQAFEKLKQCSPDCDTLSMGMSNDLESAIAQGATLVRIGTAIFGPRNKN